MKKRIGSLLLAIVALVCVTASCSDGYVDYNTFGNISGTVIDLDTGVPIQSALITLSPGGLNTYTGYDGSFDFLDLDAKQYTLTAQKPGYEVNRKTVTIIPGDVVNVSLVMKKSN